MGKVHTERVLTDFESDILKKNIELNNLSSRVTVHDYALGGQKSTVNFECDPMHKGGGRISSTANAVQQVTVETFDEVMKNVPAWRISFIKIDTEGFEFNVLAGMEKTLREMSNNACIMIESTEPNKVSAILTKYNFKLTDSKNHDHLFIKNA
jgi:FkbM family methyltransferase